MIASVFLYCATLSAPNVPDVVVDRDNMVIRESCRVIIPDGTIIEDVDGNGVIQIDADRITIEFAPGSVLTGNANLQDRDLLSGVGIRIDNHRGVTIKNPTISAPKIMNSVCDTNAVEILIPNRLPSTGKA